MINYVYVLKSLKDSKYYIGFTKNLKRRLLEHNKGKVKSTRIRVPFKLLCYEAYPNRKIARAREKFLKSNDGKIDLRRRFQS